MKLSCGIGIGFGAGPSMLALLMGQLTTRGDTLWLPGVGAVRGFATGNYVDSTGIIQAVVNDVIGRVNCAVSGVNLTQATTANKPFLRAVGDLYKWEFDSTDSLSTNFSADYASSTVIDAAPGGQVTLSNQNLTGNYSLYGGLTAAELVPDPEFNTPAKWALSAGWAISAGQAVATAAVSGSTASILIADRIAVTVGDVYQYEFTVDVLTAGGFAAVGSLLGGGPTASATGKFTGILVATATGLSSFSVRAVGATTGAVGRLALRKVLPATHGRIIARAPLTAAELSLYQRFANNLAGIP